MTDDDLRTILKEKVYFKVDSGLMHRPLYPLTDIWARLKGNDLIEVKMGFTFPLVDEEFEDVNPFDEEYYFNSVNGVGATYEAAMTTLKNKIKQIAESFWI